MLKLLSLIGSLTVGSSAIAPVVNANENNVQILEETSYANQYKKESVYNIDQALLQLGQSLFYTTASGKLNHLQSAYPQVSKAYAALNNVEHTLEVIQAKKELLAAASWIDQASRLGNPDLMNQAIGKAVISLSNAQMNIGYSVL